MYRILKGFLFNYSKKDFNTRKSEVISMISESIVNYMSDHVEMCLKSSVLSKIMLGTIE